LKHPALAALLASALAGCGADDPAISQSPSAPDDDYLPTPSGYLVHRSCIHDVPAGLSMRTMADGRTELLRGAELTGHIRPCPFPKRRSPDASTTPLQVPFVNTGDWRTFDYKIVQTIPNRFRFYDFLQATWTVPSKPAYTGQTVYFFPSLMSTNDGNNTQAILQPVLQFGKSPFGDASTTWGMAPWYCPLNASQCMTLSLVAVQPGDTIFGWVQTVGGLCNNSGTSCKYEVGFRVNGGPVMSMTVSTGLAMNMASKAALEAYNIGACSQFPPDGSTTFHDTWLTQPGPGPNDWNGFDVEGPVGSFTRLNTSQAPNCYRSLPKELANGTTLFYQK